MPLDLVEDLAHGLAELDLGRVEHRVLLVAVQLVLAAGELDDLDAVERPAVRRRDREQLVLASRTA